MIKILFDTNFLTIPYQYGIDVLTEIEALIPEKHEISVPSSVIRELEKLGGESHGRDSVAARVALQMIKKSGEITIIDVHENTGVDDTLLDLAVKNKPDVFVCTNDKILRRKLKENGVRTVCMRGKDRLIIT